jgi:spore germination cell wall hydrolase CwlJ-like protein
LDILAKTIVAEAASEPLDGQVGVAWVAKNRSRLWNRTIREICLQPKQFSCWNQDSKTASPVLLRRMAACSVDTSPEYLAAVGVAASVMVGTIPDPTLGSTHYHTVDAPPGAAEWPPYWAKAPNMIPTVRIHAHQFYKET